MSYQPHHQDPAQLGHSPPCTASICHSSNTCLSWLLYPEQLSTHGLSLLGTLHTPSSPVPYNSPLQPMMSSPQDSAHSFPPLPSPSLFTTLPLGEASWPLPMASTGPLTQPCFSALTLLLLSYYSALACLPGWALPSCVPAVISTLSRLWDM